MIGAIVGLLPSRHNDRRPSSTPGEPESPAIKAQMYVAEWRRQHQEEATEPDASVTATEAQPTTPSAARASGTTANDEDNPSTYPNGVSWVPNAIGPNLDAYPSTTSPPQNALYSSKKTLWSWPLNPEKMQNLSNFMQSGHG